jgi:hypothetical protein
MRAIDLAKITPLIHAHVAKVGTHAGCEIMQSNFFHALT